MKRREAGLPAPEPTLPGIPDKDYFRIGEVARIVGVKPYVLRYWEGEFKRDIRPERSRSNQRMYRRRDVETFLEIKRLRYEEKLELPGARRRLRKPRAGEGTEPGDEEGAAAEPNGPGGPVEEGGALVESLREGLLDLLRIVDEDEKGE